MSLYVVLKYYRNFILNDKNMRNEINEN